MFASMLTPRRIYTESGGSEAADAQREARSASQRAAELEQQVERLTLACAAMWELLQSKTGLTEDQLIDRITQIDTRDGVSDARITQAVRPCCKCRRPVPARRSRCLYCGAAQPSDGVFSSI
jgi:hypothetical protein